MGSVMICLLLLAVTHKTLGETNYNTSLEVDQSEILEKLKAIDIKLKSGLKLINDIMQDPSKEIEIETVGTTIEIINATRELMILTTFISPDDIKSDIVRRQIQRLNQSLVMLPTQGFLNYLMMLSDFEDVPRNRLSYMPDILRTTNSNDPDDFTESHIKKRNRLSYVPDILRILKNSSDPDELKYYWVTWRRDQIMSREVFDEIIEKYRFSSQLNRIHTPSSEYYKIYESPNFFNELETVVQELNPLYEQLHAILRTSVKFWYNNGRPLDDDKIPHHLIDHTLKILKEQNPILEKFEELPIKNKLTPIDIAKSAAKFFASMSMPELNSDQLTKVTTIKNSDEFCEPHIDGYYLELCRNVNMKTFLDTYGAMTKLQYRMFTKDLPAGFSSEPCPGFMDAIGNAVKLSAGTPKYLKKIGQIEDYSFDEAFRESYLLKMAYDKIIPLPMHFVNEKFITETLDRKIERQKSNCIYWEMMEKYAGIKHPQGTINGSDFDVSVSFYHEVTSNYQTKKIFSEIAGYQIYKALCEKTNQSLVEDWRNCDLSENAEIGEILMNVMQKGAEKSWQDLMEELVGTRNLSAEAMLDFYAPLMKSLKEKNGEQGSKPGWEIKSEHTFICNIKPKE